MMYVSEGYVALKQSACEFELMPDKLAGLTIQNLSILQDVKKSFVSFIFSMLLNGHENQAFQEKPL